MEPPIRTIVLLLGITILSAFPVNLLRGADSQATEAGLVFFEERIRPLLIRHCYECHSAAAAKLQGGLRVDSRDAIRLGGESGTAIVVGRPSDSLLINALRYESFEMPPKGRLTNREIEDFEHWIEMGAPDPRDHPPSSAEAAKLSWDLEFEQRKDWWSLQPLRTGERPRSDGDVWSQDPIDPFILSALDHAKLSPATEASRSVLARRLSFVLTGLPPTREQLQSVFDGSANDPDETYRKLVDQFLGSPHFGERFARHWMDVVRYTDTYGYEWDNPAKGSWEYRDYLVRALNDDIGFDQLVREQLAGDLLDTPRIDTVRALNESLVGPMFYHLGEHRHGDSLEFNGIHQDMVHNKIDAFSKAFLAQTVGCARCHDHKLDAVSQRDYYALAAVFMTPRWTARVLDSPARDLDNISELKKLQGEIDKQLKQQWRLESQSFPTELQVAISGEGQNDRSNLWRTMLGLESTDDSRSDSIPSIEDPLLPIVRLINAVEDAEIQATWEQLVAEWRTTSAAHRDDNLKTFQLVSDFSTPELPAGWTSEGAGFLHGYSPGGTPLIALSGDEVVERLLTRGYHTNLISSKLSGSLRVPSQETMAGKYVSVELAGQGWSGFLRVSENAFQTENVTFLDRSAAQWESFADIALRNSVRRVTYEIATADLNPNFPPRTGKATVGGTTLSPRDFGIAKRSWFQVTGIVTHDLPGVPADELNRFASLYDKPPPATRGEAAKTFGQWLGAAVDRWSENRAEPEDIRLINWLLEKRLLTNSTHANPQLARLTERYRSIEDDLAFPRTAIGMDERAMPPVDYPLNVRGDVDDPGSNVSRDFLQVFDGQHQVGESPMSGRLELADFLVGAGQHLTARVYVNRVWQWVFGEGLVRTPNDFGHLGAAPSHPELLDYLAREFVADGWSTKRLVRRLVLSRTFRQSGQRSQPGADTDPGNELLHHFSTRRLEAEALRDSLLAVSGRLDHQLFGPPIDPPRFVEDEAKRLFCGPIDGDGRRSIYIRMSIMSPPGMMVGFNLPDLRLPTGRRHVTNDPAQALILLNHPFVHAQARRWAQKLVIDGKSEPEDRIRDMFIEGLGRLPVSDELAEWTRFARDCANAPQHDMMTDEEVWFQMAHTMFNTKEFIYFR